MPPPPVQTGNPTGHNPPHASALLIAFPINYNARCHLSQALFFILCVRANFPCSRRYPNFVIVQSIDSLRRIQGAPFNPRSMAISPMYPICERYPLWEGQGGSLSHSLSTRLIPFHIIQECPAADSQAQYIAKPKLPLVLAELTVTCEFNAYVCEISIALAIRLLDLSALLIPRWGFGLVWLGFLYTFRAAGALKGWCAVRTLQEMVGSAHPTNVQSRAKKLSHSSSVISSTVAMVMIPAF